MGRRAQVLTTALIVLCGVGLWIWLNAASPDEQEIRRRLNELTREFNTSKTEGVASVAWAARIGHFFTSDVVVELGRGSPPIHGRETLIGMAARLQPGTAAFLVTLEDVNVEIVEPARAEITLTLVISRRSAPSSEESLDAREFSAGMRKADGEWRISRVTAIDTFR